MVIACRYSKFWSSSILVILIVLILFVSIIHFENTKTQTNSSTDPKELLKVFKTENDTIQKDIQEIFNKLINEVKSQWNELPPDISLGHVHLHVSNLAKAKRFYNNILELNHTATYPGAYFFASNKYHHHVATNICLGENIPPGYNDNNKPGLDHYAIELHNKNDLFLLKDRLLKFKIDIDNAYSIEKIFW